MATVLPSLFAVSQNLLAGFLLGARAEFGRLGLPTPNVNQILEATGAGRSRAYEYKGVVLEALPGLARPAGRPPTAESPSPATTTTDGEITRAILDHVVKHPGCVYGGEKRRRYSDGFRRFVLDLRERYCDLDLPAFADAAGVPLPTLKEWLRGGAPDTDDGETARVEKRAGTQAEGDATSAHIQTILDEWRGWEGDLSTYVGHLKYNLRIPSGRTFIADVLEQYGERTPERRPGRSPDEKALRDLFETFFPGAQWEGDGTPLVVWVDDQSFGFNLELMADADSDAFVGASLRDEEDGQAVIEAFGDGVETTGAPPLAATLDNRSSNHTEQVVQALGDTIGIRATKGRPQNKPHVEGAFGLFVQSVPLLAITTGDPEQTARQLARIVTQSFFRTLNHKPRQDRGGRSRVQLYREADPTPEQIEEARAALEERRRRQEKAHRTIKARQDPVVREILDEAFSRLELQDPSGNIHDAIARYPLDAVLAGIAIYETRQAANTLPLDVEGPRYLFGIVRNIATENEGMQISEALLDARLDASDRILKRLYNAHEIIALVNPEPLDRLRALVDKALDAQRRIDWLFWLKAAADLVNVQPVEQHADLYRIAARRIHATHAVPYKDRLAAARFLADRVISLN